MSSNRSGSGCGGWALGILALLAAVVSLGISGGVAVGGLAGESHDLAGVLAIVALIALGLARRQER